jgi:hypothetical protein
MSLANYSDLKAAVARWMKRTDLAEFIPDFIAMGEARIYRDLRIRAMETALNATISGGVIAVPAGYVELKNARIELAPVRTLVRKDAEWIYANYPMRSGDGFPKFIARETNSFIFGPYPDSGYTVKGTYYRRLDPLSDDNTFNWFTTNAPDLLLFAALCETEPFMKNDARVQLWEAKYGSVKDQVQSEDNREAFSGSPLSMTAR